MNNIFKILVILVVAVLVGGLFYGAVTVTSSGTSQASSVARPDGDVNRPDQGDDGGGLQFPAESIKSLAIITIVSIIYLNAPKWVSRKKTIMEAAR